MSDQKSRISAAELNHQRTLEWFTRFDARVAVAFGIDTGMVGVLATTIPDPHNLTVVAAIMLIVTSILLGATFLFLQSAMHPDTRAPAGSLLFWGEIAGKKTEEFETAWNRTEDSAYLRDLLEQTHRCSEILCKKFERLRLAYRCLFFSIVPWAIAIYLFRLAPLKTH